MFAAVRTLVITKLLEDDPIIPIIPSVPLVSKIGKTARAALLENGRPDIAALAPLAVVG